MLAKSNPMQPTLPLKDIIVEGRLREDMKNVEELAESIRDNGLLQPIVVEAKYHPLMNEKQEDVGGTTTYELRAGGRRYTAFTLLNSYKVKCENPDFYLNIPVMLFNEMPAHQRIVIELEENFRRESMTWQEEVKGIVLYHKAKAHAAVLDDRDWSQKLTARLLNMKQAAVSVAFTVYDELKKGNEKVKNAANLFDAVKIIAADDLDIAQAERLRRIQLRRAEQTVEASKRGDDSPIVSAVVKPEILLSARGEVPTMPTQEVGVTLEQVASFYHHGNAIDLLPLLAKSISINHIICDPPYAIDLINLSRSDSDRFGTIQRVAETHEVSDNLRLIPEFLKVSFDCIAEDGFLCMWYDLDHHEKIREWAEDIGWRTQRWPFHWCKTSPCLNQAAQVNITKAVEHCYIFRRSENSVIKKKQSVNYLCTGGDTSSSHPFTKPKAVWDYLIETVSLEGQTIVDPFAGEGSSLAAIFQSKRTPVGIELDEKHIASGLSFVQSRLNKKSILDDLLTGSVI